MVVAGAVLSVPALVLAQDAPPPADPRVSLSGYVQPRYDHFSSNGDTTDKWFLRRAVLDVKANLSSSWNGELQLDAGPPSSSGDPLLVKDAVLRYTGWEPNGLTLTIGNQKMPFSLSSMQSASRRSQVERPVTGSADYGAPGRSIGVRADGWHHTRKIHWAAALAASQVSPEPTLLSIHGITESDADWNDGNTLVGRLEFHPFGEVSLSQGDLERKPMRVVFAAAAYRWTNDHDGPDQEDGDVEVRSMTGVEISGGLRGAGLSLDAEYQHIAADAADPLFGNGIYLAGQAVGNKGSLEAGYMLWRDRVEVTAALDAFDTDAFDEPWRRASIGMNWYVNGHALKFSVMHRESFNASGVRGARSHATYVQSHFAF